MVTRDVEIGPNNTMRLGVAATCGAVLLAGAALAFNANAKIATLSASLENSTERQIRIETKVDELGDRIESKVGELSNKLDMNMRDTISRLATLEAQMKVVQSAQSK